MTQNIKAYLIAYTTTTLIMINLIQSNDDILFNIQRDNLLFLKKILSRARKWSRKTLVAHTYGFQEILSRARD